MSTPRQNLPCYADEKTGQTIHRGGCGECPPDRCAVCGWPLVENRDDGCQPGDCSMRPFPEHIYDPERANREYKGSHKFQVAKSESVEPTPSPEPMTAEQFWPIWFSDDFPTTGNKLDPIAFAQAYADMVSKQLKLELATLRVENWANRRRADTAEGKLESLRARISELELKLAQEKRRSQALLNLGAPAELRTK